MIKIRTISLIFTAILLLTFCSSNKEFESITSTFEDGSPKIVNYYADEELTQLKREVRYYQNGQKRMAGKYRKGKRNGLWNAWYADGTPWSEGEYVEGVEQGIRRTYYPNGQVFYEGMMEDGERKGLWKFFKESGELDKELNYD